MNSTLAIGLAGGHLQLVPDMQSTAAFLDYSPFQNSTDSALPSIQLFQLQQYDAKNLLLKHHKHNEELSDLDSMMISKSAEGYYIFNNITLKVR